MACSGSWTTATWMLMHSGGGFTKTPYDVPDLGSVTRCTTNSPLILGDSPKDSDIPDFAHINAIPYVDAATLDRRMLHYFRTVVSKLRTLNASIAYDVYVYPSVGDLMTHLN